MNDFAFHAPESLKEAADLLAQYDGDGKLIAGGTSLMLLLKQSLVQPDHLISLHRVPEARGIEVKDGVLHIGGLVTQREVEHLAERFDLRLLAAARQRDHALQDHDAGDGGNDAGATDSVGRR